MTLKDKCILVPIALLILLSMIMVDANKESQLPIRGGCLQLSPEVPEFRLQGDAVVLRCGFLESYLQMQRFSLTEGNTIHFLRDYGNGTEVSVHTEDRVREQRHQLWFLPAQAADSGTYSCVFRNASYCCATTIALQVYETRQPHLDAISYPMFAYHGQKGKIRCYHLKEFSISGNLQWYKESTPIVFSVNRTRYRRDTNTTFTIQDVSTADEGFYTCKVQVLFNNTEYIVTRVTKLSVKAPGPRLPKENLRPKIVDPVNGTFFQSYFGSSLSILCKVSTGNQSADFTDVIWFINGLFVEESFLSGRALLGEMMVTIENGDNYIELELIILEVHEEDTRAEIKCVAQNSAGRDEVMAHVRLEDSILAWLVVAAAGTICFLTMVCVFLYQFLKPKRKSDYILARQHSTF
ncbi:hypothetical protein AAFF_G00209220 [Aldrovandia affinis]|uniref:Ig-like domain-containing protein n=1 Tax=Aldrovandia affinis TaxID=143900 RepID=A0AAD7SY58_9TELE|nr:hypothetical protein AAFF_G00209220 [Aldrovandia affinis]